MIRSIPWLWKQLCGPQISAYTRGVFNSMRTWLDSKLDYISTLSIDTANDSHLTLLGMCMGITRPMITQSPEAYFLFTRILEHGNSHGVSQQPHDSVGGMFIDALDPKYSWSTQLAPKEEFRKVLKATRDSKGVIGSLEWISDVVHAFITGIAPVGQLAYKIQWYDDHRTGDDTRNWGDIEVLVNSECISSTSATLIAAMLQGIFREVLGPLYWVDVNLVGNIPATKVSVTLDFTTNAYEGGYVQVPPSLLPHTAESLYRVYNDALKNVYGEKEVITTSPTVGMPTMLARWYRPYNSKITDISFVGGSNHSGTYDSDSGTLTVEGTIYGNTFVVPTNALHQWGDGLVSLSWMTVDTNIEEPSGVELYYDGSAIYLRSSVTNTPIAQIYYEADEDPAPAEGDNFDAIVKTLVDDSGQMVDGWNSQESCRRVMDRWAELLGTTVESMAYFPPEGATGWHVCTMKPSDDLTDVFFNVTGYLVDGSFDEGYNPELQTLEHVEGASMGDIIVDDGSQSYLPGLQAAWRTSLYGQIIILAGVTTEGALLGGGSVKKE